MTITIIPLTTGEFQNPDGSFFRFPPDGTPGLGRTVELQGDGGFTGTDLGDSIFTFNDLPKAIFGLGGNDGGTAFGSGAVTFSGNSGNDFFAGGLGNDIFYGGVGVDNGNGGEGNDLVFGDSDDDRLAGGLGDDTLLGGLGDDRLSEQGTLGGDNSFFGGQGNDLLLGGLGNEFLSGDAGNDDIEGDGGNDTLSGGEGFDLLTGGSRAVMFTGDEVQDVFAVEVNTEFDLVADFEDGIDKLGLPTGLAFEDLLIAPLGSDAALLSPQPSVEWSIEPTDIAIRLATTGQVLTVLNANVGGDPTLPVLGVAQITAEDFVTL